jgi:hypothetical protein
MSSDPKHEPSADRSPGGSGTGRRKPQEPGTPGIKDGGPVLDREPQGTERGYDEAVRTPGDTSPE